MKIKAISLLPLLVIVTNISASAQGLDKGPTRGDSAVKFSQLAKQVPTAKSGSSKEAPHLVNRKLKDSISQSAPAGVQGATTRKGGVVSGGGNKLQSLPVNGNEIAEIINNIKIPTDYAIRRVEMFLSWHSRSMKIEPPLGVENDQRLQSLNRKLFGGKINIYEALQQADLRPQWTGPCLDHDGNEVDGSATDAPIICLSIERLSDMIKDSAQRELVALVAHEVSHMLGTDEAEATLFQHMVRENLPVDTVTRVPELVKNYSQALEDAVANAQALKDLAGKNQTQMACTLIGGLQAQLTALLHQAMERSSSAGIMFLRPMDVEVLVGTILKAINVTEPCLPKEDTKVIEQAFKGRKEMSLQEFNRIVYQNLQNDISVPNWKIRRIQNGSESLKLEAAEILQALQALQKIM